MPFTQTIQVIATQGNNTINKTSYVSGTDFLQSAPFVPASGLTSGIALSFYQSGIVSLVMGNALPATSGLQLQIKAYSLSGAVSFTQPGGGVTAWNSGNGFSNPLAIASGDIAGYSLQLASGYSTTNSSGYGFSLQVMTITP